MLAGNILILFERDDATTWRKSSSSAAGVRGRRADAQGSQALGRGDAPGEGGDPCNSTISAANTPRCWRCAATRRSRCSLARCSTGPVRDGARTRRAGIARCAIRVGDARRGKRMALEPPVAFFDASARRSRDDQSAHGRGGAVPESRGIREGGEHLRRRQGFPPRETNHGEGIFAEVASPVRARQGERGETRRSGGGVRTRTGFRQRRSPTPAAPERPGARVFPGSNVAVDGGGGARGAPLQVAGRRPTRDRVSSPLAGRRGGVHARAGERPSGALRGRARKRRDAGGVSPARGVFRVERRAREGGDAHAARARTPPPFALLKTASVDRAIDVAGEARNDAVTAIVVEYLSGNADGAPKDHAYLFKLRAALREHDAAARVSAPWRSKSRRWATTRSRTRSCSRRTRS